MSARAIRKLQGNNVLAHLAGGDDDDDDEDDYDSSLDNRKKQVSAKPKAVNAFALMSHDDDDDDSSSSSSEEEVETQEKDVGKEQIPVLLVEEEKEEEDFDDILNEFKEIDHIDGPADSSSDSDVKMNRQSLEAGFASLLLQGLDVRDLDMEYTMRNALLQDPLDNVQQHRNNNKKGGGSGSRTTNNSFLFGSPRDDWKLNRPPNFIGGGMGMIPYDGDNNSNNAAAAAASVRSILSPPWPYPQNINNNNNNADSGGYNSSCWYTFRHGDAIQRDVHDFEQLIVHQGAGNVNALLLFVAHHAYTPSALLQLSTVLYQTNHNVEALSMMKRCLYIYECARLYKFTKHIGGGDSSSNQTMALLDYSLPENAPFFEALVQLMRACTNAGLYKSTFAICRYILSLDQLRDPMGMLLVLDSFALHQVMTNHPAVSSSLLKWFMALCENNKDLKIWYRDPDDPNSSYSCDLLHMPNWAYSYAVALYQMSLLAMDDNNDADNDHDAVESPPSSSSSWKDRAKKAIQQAMRAHPTVVGQLLLACEVDTTGRSFQRDWPTVLRQATDAAQRLVQAQFSTCTTADETIIVTATLQSVDKVISIYAKVAAKTWCQGGGNNNDNERRNDLFQWLHDNLVATMQEEERISNLKPPPSAADGTENIKNNGKEHNTRAQSDDVDHVSSPPAARLLHPALMRYAKFQLSDFISNVAVLQLPGDVMNAQDNIIDPGMLAHAMVIDPRRPRFRRFMERGGGGMGGGRGQGHDFDGDDDFFAELQQQQRLFQQFGGPPRGIVDPDWPAMEVFWRSFLPWNHVDGVAPPPPPPPGAL